MKILIRTTEDKKFWTRAYVDNGEFLKFKSKTKDGNFRDVMVNKKYIIEITEMEGDFEGDTGEDK